MIGYKKRCDSDTSLTVTFPSRPCHRFDASQSIRKGAKKHGPVIVQIISRPLGRFSAWPFPNKLPCHRRWIPHCNPQPPRTPFRQCPHPRQSAHAKMSHPASDISEKRQLSGRDENENVIAIVCRMVLQGWRLPSSNNSSSSSSNNNSNNNNNNSHHCRSLPPSRTLNNLSTQHPLNQPSHRLQSRPSSHPQRSSPQPNSRVASAYGQPLGNDNANTARW